MLVFDPSKMKFFKKDDDGEQESNDQGVKTFFDTLNLKGGGGGSVSDEESEEDEEDEEDEDSSDDPSDDSASSPELTTLQEQLKQAQEQNDKLMQLIKGKEEQEEEDPTLENPFDNESFDNLSEAMNWDDSERKAMKSFLQNALDYQSQSTITTATADIDNIINSKMSQAEKKKAVQKQFFAENPKLHPVKDYVSTVASGILNEYKALGKPLNPAEILKEAAKRAYKVLGIDPKAKGNKDNESERDHEPAFPSSRASSKKRNQKINKTTTQKMITSMIDL